ncbi:hypothetical protein GCK32_014743, partial [Trichostrongylus colubriformis]
YYTNRNLLDEDEHRRRRFSELNRMRMLQNRAQELQNSDPKLKRFLLGKRAQKKSTHQGLIMASIGSLGVHAVEAGLGEQGSPTDEGLTMKSKLTDEHALYTIRERSESLTSK